jgi:hypothetical protein
VRCVGNGKLLKRKSAYLAEEYRGQKERYGRQNVGFCGEVGVKRREKCGVGRGIDLIEKGNFKIDLASPRVRLAQLQFMRFFALCYRD